MLGMWKPITIIALFLVFLFIRGCPVATDGLFQVKGKIVLSSGKEPEGCSLKLFEPKREFVRELDVSAQFDKGITIAPSKRKYFMEFTCQGVEKPFQTQTYELGDRVQQIDLGTIVLDDSSKNP